MSSCRVASVLPATIRQFPFIRPALAFVGLALVGLALVDFAFVGLATFGLSVGLASVGGSPASFASLRARSLAVLAATARLSASYSLIASAASRARSSFIESLAALFCVSLEEAMGVSYSGFRSV